MEDEFLERHKLPKRSDEKMDDLKSPRSIKEIKYVVKNLPMRKLQGPDGFPEIYQTLK